MVEFWINLWEYSVGCKDLSEHFEHGCELLRVLIGRESFVNSAQYLESDILKGKGLVNVELVFERTSANDGGCEHEDVFEKKLPANLISVFFERGPGISDEVNSDLRAFLLDLLFLLVWLVDYIHRLIDIKN